LLKHRIFIILIPFIVLNYDLFNFLPIAFKVTRKYMIEHYPEELIYKSEESGETIELRTCLQSK
jgi:hypothetical protein